MTYSLEGEPQQVTALFSALAEVQTSRRTSIIHARPKGLGPLECDRCFRSF